MKASTIFSPGSTKFNRYARIFLFSVSILILFSACEDQRIQTVEWTEYEPVYMTEQEFNNVVSMEE